MSWLVTNNIKGRVALADIPRMDYAEFHAALKEALWNEAMHVATYFAAPRGDEMIFYCLLLDDSSGEVCITSHTHGYYDESGLESLVGDHPQMHVFEREISERYGIRFNGSPWQKPLRYPIGRADVSSRHENYPFYKMEGESLHEVNVGPIHAGIIEPGVFRFICNGEKVLHLEIVLGFQHRGMESLMVEAGHTLRRMILSENIAGDSAVSHAVACAMVHERLAGLEISHAMGIERAIAIEMERIAMHIADTGALCGDIGYQLGQVACEAMRTVVINTTQMWCGNRFGKGLVRTGGSYYPITGEIMKLIVCNLRDVQKRYDEVRRDLKSTPSVLARFEECGNLSTVQALRIGVVGVGARASGLPRDIRATHSWGVFGDEIVHKSIVRTQGDVMARLMVRTREVRQSIDYVISLLGGYLPGEIPSPVYGLSFSPDIFAFSLVEGWRGEICHCALTDRDGNLSDYRIIDPSIHNWQALAVCVRGGGISDFPICNKSFNLSYCGHDL